jgi:N-ethylmaleimide reductase
MLFSPLTLGELELPNRLVMAPLTRVRTGQEGVPGPLWWSTTASVRRSA